MNSRRSFFKSLALIGAGAVAAPGIFIPKFEPVHWKVARPPMRHGLYYAEFRYTILPMQPKYDPFIFARGQQFYALDHLTDHGIWVRETTAPVTEELLQAFKAEGKTEGQWTLLPFPSPRKI